MKIKTALVIGTLVALGPMSPSFAVEPGPTNAREMAPPARNLRHAIGDVVSVNRMARMFTLRTSGGGTMQLTADAGLTPKLGTLKKGERVKVSYKHTQGQRIATKIIPV
jgi:hypothetical protein